MVHRESALKEPGQAYDKLVEVLGSDHLVLHRPFLVFRLAGMLAGKVTAAEIKEEIGPSVFSVVPKIIRSFLQREVGEKWRGPKWEAVPHHRPAHQTIEHDR